MVLRPSAALLCLSFILGGTGPGVPENPKEKSRAGKGSAPHPARTPASGPSEKKPPPADRPSPESLAEDSAPISAKVEPDKLRVDPTVFLGGKKFPDLEDVKTDFAQPRRIFYVSPDAVAEGDGTQARPWKDVQAGLCRLEPGDRLVLLPGFYSGSFSVAGSCKNGTAQAPIQVFGEEAFLQPPSSAAVLTVARAFWQFWELQMVLGDSGAAGFVTEGSGAHDILLDQSHIYQGKGTAVRIGSESSRVTISNCHIHQTLGVRVEGGARDVTLTGNKIHHNQSSAVTVGGADSALSPKGFVEKLTIVRNKFHNDTGGALDLTDSRQIRIAENKIYNYRPAGGFQGQAVSIGRNVADLVLEANFLAEASTGIRVGTEDAGQPPQNIRILRNYLENRLTRDSVAVEIRSGRNIGIYNNTIDHYAEAFRVVGATSRAEHISIANNLVLQTSATAFRLAHASSVEYFDHNLFSRKEDVPFAEIGGARVSLTNSIASGKMPSTKLSREAELIDRDLARTSGVSVVDLGRAVKGLPFKGSAPDIGAAEK